MTPADLLTALSLLSLLAWIHLLAFHGRFWMGDQRLGADPAPPAAWPAVAAVVPARNEADVIGETLPALLAQQYPGQLRVVLVDDESDDGTAERALAVARVLGPAAEARLCVLRSKPRPEGWMGKTWALHCGIERARSLHPEADFLWLVDADVAPAPRTLRRLVAKGCAEGLDLVSLMVLLHAGSGWSRLLVPAFVYFFQKLYPFPLVNDPASRRAGAAGGCVLLRADALARAGGIAAIRDAVIDDCALGAAVKRVGRVWLGLGVEERSLRPYGRLGDVWEMVARSAYTQLRYSPPILVGVLAGLVLLYALPVASLLAWPLHASGTAALLGAGAWLAMSVSFLPTLVLYRRSPLWAPGLPVAGVLYAAMTLDSAIRHHRGRGARWKGRRFG